LPFFKLNLLDLGLGLFKDGSALPFKVALHPPTHLFQVRLLLL
jgi:hypothetical protein